MEQKAELAQVDQEEAGAATNLQSANSLAVRSTNTLNDSVSLQGRPDVGPQAWIVLLAAFAVQGLQWGRYIQITCSQTHLIPHRQGYLSRMEYSRIITIPSPDHSKAIPDFQRWVY